MDLIFLGTSAGTPTRERNVTGLALREDGGRSWYLVDCGEGTQHRVQQAGLSLHELQAIFITHVHGDHCYGLPGLLDSAGMQGRKRPLTVVAPQSIATWIDATRSLTDLWAPFELHFVAVETLDGWHNGNWRVERVPLSHRVPSFAYRFGETTVEAVLDTDKLLREGIARGPLWGSLQRGEDVMAEDRTLRAGDYLLPSRTPRGIIVGGDNDTPELLREACAGSQVLVHEATYTSDVAARVGPVGHSAAGSIAGFAQSAGLPHLILTHFSPRYQSGPASPSIEDIRAEAAAVYTGNLVLARDLGRWRLQRDGRLVEMGSP